MVLGDNTRFIWGGYSKDEKIFFIIMFFKKVSTAAAALLRLTVITYWVSGLTILFWPKQV